MDGVNGEVSELERARLKIVHLKLDDSSDLWRVVAGAMRISAATLGVARVGLWLLSADRDALHEIVIHGERVGLPATLPLSKWPMYLGAILSRRVVVADDARIDPRTSELGADYLDPLRVGAMLDAPVFIRGEVWGVVCHEHLGAPRRWTAREVDFAVSVADMLSALLEQSSRLFAEKQRREEEASLARARRAEALARAGAGIAHDFNTVLQAITSSAERAAAATDDAERKGAVARILEDARRGTRIAADLTDVARTRKSPPQRLDLAFVVDDLRSTIESLLGERHALVTELAGDAQVPATRAEIERIVLNLVTNARDAMPEGGTVKVGVAANDGVVSLTVRDEGTGIEPDLVDHIFEPYFTTRSGRSSGLGLFTVDAIAARTGARVSVSSDPGAGTEMTVAWPA